MDWEACLVGEGDDVEVYMMYKVNDDCFGSAISHEIHVSAIP